MGHYDQLREIAVLPCLPAGLSVEDSYLEKTGPCFDLQFVRPNDALARTLSFLNVSKRQYLDLVLARRGINLLSSKPQGEGTGAFRYRGDYAAAWRALKVAHDPKQPALLTDDQLVEIMGKRQLRWPAGDRRLRAPRLLPAARDARRPADRSLPARHHRLHLGIGTHRHVRRLADRRCRRRPDRRRARLRLRQRLRLRRQLFPVRNRRHSPTCRAAAGSKLCPPRRWCERHERARHGQGAMRLRHARL